MCGLYYTQVITTELWVELLEMETFLCKMREIVEVDVCR